MLAVVSDSSPLIYFTRLGIFPALRQLHERVLVPPAVWQEITVGGAGREEEQNVRRAAAEGWIQVQAPAVQHAELKARTDLGRGEIEAILLARQLQAVLLTDDAAARETARNFSVLVTGTVGLLVRLKSEGHVASIQPLLDALRRTNFRMSETLYRNALSQAHEN